MTTDFDGGSVVTMQQWCEAHGDVVSPKRGLVML